MAATKEKVLSVLKAEIGTTEQPPGSNRTKYGAWYPMNGVPWCMIFQCWVEDKAGGLLMPKTAYTPTAAQFFIDERRWGKEPRLGALAFFNFPDSLDRIQHVGRVIALDGGIPVCGEGNTSSGATGSQDNGDGVYRKQRSSYIVGFGYPFYEKDVPRFEVPEARTWFGRKDKGADVLRWQRQLNAWMRLLRELKGEKLDFDFGRIDTDSTFGAETVKATLTFQGYYELDTDARVGKHTVTKMEAILRRMRAREA